MSSEYWEPRDGPVEGEPWIRYRRPHGTYRVGYRMDNGLLRWHSVGSDLEHARRVRDDFHALHADGIPIRASDLTLDQLLQEWLAAKEQQQAAGGLREETLERYRAVVAHQIEPKLMKHPSMQHYRRLVRNLVPAVVEKFLDELANDGHPDTTCKLVQSVLRQLLEFARRRGDVAYNAVDRSNRPRTPSTPRRSRPTPHPLSRDDLERLLEAADTQWRLPFLLAAETGTHTSELLPLRWTDIDHNFLTITSHLNGRTGAIVAYHPDDRRRRIVQLSPRLKADLMTARAARPGTKPDALLFPGPSGSCRTIRSFDLAVKKAAGRAGLTLTAATLRASATTHPTRSR